MALDLDRINAGEDKFTEFKREYTEEIKKAVVAFANTEGGTLYIGIDNDGTIVGVNNIDDTMLQVSNAVRSAIKPDVTLFVDIKKEKVSKSAILVVTVQKGTACPYYLSGKGIRPEGVYVRQGASSVPASETAILNMIKDTDGEKYESVRSLNQDLTFKTAKEYFYKKDIPFGKNYHKTLKLQNTDGIYTNLALLLSDQSSHIIRLAVFEGLEKEIFKDRREFSGSLLKQLQEVYEFLDKYNRTHAEIDGLIRIEKRDYPEEALREALLNALIHRDYSFSSSILISIFDDRIEFVSIGGLPKGVSLDDILLGVSVLRNENLAAIFYRLQLIEAYGTGIPRIIRSYANCKRKPELQTSDNAFKIMLPNQNMENKKTENVNIDKTRLTENEMRVMKLFKRRNEITRKDVESALSISQAMAVRILRQLVDKEFIYVIGEGKNIRYTLAAARRKYNKFPIVRDS